MATIAVDSVEIPSEFVELASQWYSGQSDLLYAVASTGGLTLGNRRPLGCDTDEQWYLQLWQGLSADVAAARRDASKGKSDDLPQLKAFETFVDEQVDRLTVDFGLEDWEG